MCEPWVAGNVFNSLNLALASVVICSCEVLSRRIGGSVRLSNLVRLRLSLLKEDSRADGEDSRGERGARKLDIGRSHGLEGVFTCRVCFLVDVNCRICVSRDAEPWHPRSGFTFCWNAFV